MKRAMEGMQPCYRSCYVLHYRNGGFFLPSTRKHISSCHITISISNVYGHVSHVYGHVSHVYGHVSHDTGMYHMYTGMHHMYTRQ